MTKLEQKLKEIRKRYGFGMWTPDRFSLQYANHEDDIATLLCIVDTQHQALVRMRGHSCGSTSSNVWCSQMWYQIVIDETLVTVEELVK